MLYELLNIAHGYNDRPVLTIDQWKIPVDTVTGVVGPNGSGKSTLLSLLGFVMAPTHGRIKFKGQSARPFADNVRAKVALLSQDSFLLKRSVYSNIAYGLKIKKAVNGEGRRVREAMEMVGLDFEAFANRPWYALSGGEARRVALAARLALKPEVLLLDEPTTSVDAASAQMIKEAALHARMQWGTTLIIASHNTEWLADISDSMVHLFRGSILGSGKQTLIFGPWESKGDRFLMKALTPEQIFEAHGDPHDLKTAVAAIEAKQISLYRKAEQIPSSQHRLKGLLLRLSYEQATHQTSAAVIVGGTVFNVYLPETETATCRFIPGRDVWLGYDSQAVAWY